MNVSLGLAFVGSVFLISLNDLGLLVIPVMNENAITKL